MLSCRHSFAHTVHLSHINEWWVNVSLKTLRAEFAISKHHPLMCKKEELDSHRYWNWNQDSNKVFVRSCTACVSLNFSNPEVLRMQSSWACLVPWWDNFWCTFFLKLSRGSFLLPLTALPMKVMGRVAHVGEKCSSPSGALTQWNL